MDWFKTKRIFLDYAAATPMLPEVKRAMEKYWSRDFYNPSAIYEEGLRVKRELSHFKKRVAELFGAREDGIIFTSGGTEANVLAIRGVKAGKIIVEPDSHPSAHEAVIKNNAKEITLISSVTTDNKLGRKIREERKKNDSKYPLLHIDASQSAQYCDVGLEILACDLITLDGAKLYGPKGVGALVVRNGVKLTLPPRGTPPMPLIAGFVKALEIAVRDRENERMRLSSLKRQFVSAISEAHSSVVIREEEPNIIHVSVPASPAGRPNILPEFLALALDKEGVLVSVGPACDSNKPEPDDTPVRFSIGRFTTEKEIKRVAEIFCSTVQSMLKSTRQV